MNYYKSSFTLLLTILIISGCQKKSSDESNTTKEETSSLIANYPTEVLASDVSLTKITEGYKFDTAGSPLYMNGSLYFTNNNFEEPELSRTMRLAENGSVDTLAMDNGVTTTLQASRNGTIYACQMLGHQVVELNNDGEVIKVIASDYNGKRIDGPNDIVVDQKGGLYFSDSQYLAGGEKMQENPAVYYVNQAGEIKRVIDDIPFPNGMALSPNGSILYVANTSGQYLLAYDVQNDGELQNRRKFAELEMPEHSSESGADGMAIDIEGNIYVATTKGIGVQVFNSQGKYLGSINTPTPSNNVSFGGPDNQTMYITAKDGIYSIPVKIQGL